MTMNVDSIFAVIGEFGPYQKRIYFLLCLFPFVTSFQIFISTFILATPMHRCAIPGWSNDTYIVQNKHHEDIINKTIPRSSDQVYDQCHIYGDNGTLRTCERWVYDKTLFQSTFTTENNIVCNDGYKTSLSSMCYFAGVIVSANGFGYLSDLIGRKKTLYLSVCLTILSTISIAWSPSYWVFVLFRFIIGMCGTGLYVTSFVLGMEIVGPSKRIWTGIILNYFFGAGFVLLGVVAYFIRDWMYLQIAVSVPVVIFLSYWWLLPESPRWLVQQGRLAEADALLRTITIGNKTVIPNKFQVNTKMDPVQAGKMCDLFTNRVLLFRTLIIVFNWISISMGYYGLSLSTHNLSGNFYLNFILSGITEFIAYTLCLFFLDRVGRKKFHASCVIIGGFACLSTIFTMLYAEESLQPITVALSMFGKTGIAASFACIYVWAAELYPTVVRNTGIGIGCSFGNIGAMISPYIADINKLITGNLGRALPFVIFGSLSILAGILSLWLPETLNHNLPETIEDGIHFGRLKESKMSRKRVNLSKEENM